MLKHVIHGILGKVGYKLIKIEPSPLPQSVPFPSDFDEQTVKLIEAVRPYTMTSPERIAALQQAVQYITAHKIPGAVVECGVWKGGSMMAVARTLKELGDTNRTLFLFDTFSGMTEPTEADKQFSGESAKEILQAADKSTSDVWAVAPLKAVQAALRTTGYPEGNFVYIEGKVEETIPEHAPQQIALLRLDTDWYASTYHELVHLWPRLSVGGVLIIDDYGYWQGARKAVDQFFSERQVFLSRIDFTGRIAIKQ